MTAEKIDALVGEAEELSKRLQDLPNDARLAAVGPTAILLRAEAANVLDALAQALRETQAENEQLRTAVNPALANDRDDFMVMHVVAEVRAEAAEQALREALPLLERLVRPGGYKADNRSWVAMAASAADIAEGELLLGRIANLPESGAGGARPGVITEYRVVADLDPDRRILYPMARTPTQIGEAYDDLALAFRQLWSVLKIESSSAIRYETARIEMREVTAWRTVEA